MIHFVICIKLRKLEQRKKTESRHERQNDDNSVLNLQTFYLEIQWFKYLNKYKLKKYIFPPKKAITLWSESHRLLISCESVMCLKTRMSWQKVSVVGDESSEVSPWRFWRFKNKLAGTGAEWGSSFDDGGRHFHLGHFWQMWVWFLWEVRPRLIWTCARLSVSAGLRPSSRSHPSRWSLPPSGAWPRQQGHWMTAAWMWWGEEEVGDPDRKRRGDWNCVLSQFVPQLRSHAQHTQIHI